MGEAPKGTCPICRYPFGWDSNGHPDVTIMESHYWWHKLEQLKKEVQDEQHNA